jgi:lipid-binding SYLF domain-containing protein
VLGLINLLTNSEKERPVKLLKGILIVVAFVFSTGFFGADGDSPDEKRKTILKMSTDTLAELYEHHPQAEDAVKKAAGYAVFSNIGINLFIVSTGNGFGMAHDNTTGKDTYMNMLSGGVGIGLGVKDFRGIFIFSGKENFEDFINKGWTASGQADVAAKAGEEGGAMAGAIDVAPGVKLYQLTETGLALQATIQGTKYYKDDELN